LLTRRGLRRSYHLARFEWTARMLRQLQPRGFSLIELGCFDGRLLEMIDDEAGSYVGIDANWEGGIDRAIEQFRGRARTRFLQSCDPQVFGSFRNKQFDCSVALETLEHLPEKELPQYLDGLARVTKHYCLVTVPNELGPVFLAKYLAKWAYYRDADHYRFKEIVAATLRRSHEVERCEHKGFDYREIVRELGCRFETVTVEAVFPRWVPGSFALTIGIVARAVGASRS